MNGFLYTLTVLIWGTTWLAITFQLGKVPVEASIVYRFALAAVVLFVGLLLSGRLQRLDGRAHLRCVAQGVCLFSLNFLCFYQASQWLPSGLVAVVFSTAPLWNALNSRLWLKQSQPLTVWLGAGCGLLGLLLLFSPQWRGLDGQMLPGLGLALLGTLCFSFGNLLSGQQQAAGWRPLSCNAWGMAYGASLLAGYCVLQGVPFGWDERPRYLLALLYLAIPGSVIGFTAYLTLVGRIGAARAAYCTVLFPLVALNLSAWLEGYQWGPAALAGLLLVMLGNCLAFMPAGSAQRWRARIWPSSQSRAG